MAQRFNPPPGWNVPPDFIPTSDWKPDPSWPPAPDGWTYWVDDTAPQQQSFGSSSAPQAPSYGTPPSPAVPTYGAPAQQDASPYGAQQFGSASTPPGAYAGGSAQSAMGEAQRSGAKKSIGIGIALFIGSIVVTVVTYSVAEPGGRFWVPWYIGLAGIVLAIRGAIEMNKANKTIAASQGFTTGGMPPGPGGPTPPGTF